MRLYSFNRITWYIPDGPSEKSTVNFYRFSVGVIRTGLFQTDSLTFLSCFSGIIASLRLTSRVHRPTLAYIHPIRCGYPSESSSVCLRLIWVVPCRTQQGRSHWYGWRRGPVFTNSRRGLHSLVQCVIKYVMY